ncbi:MAG: glucose-6-phosphate dehydrogenase [Clostridiales bacterium]
MDKMEKPDNCILVIFGASGDLTSRKLVPSLFRLYKQDLLPDKFVVLGVGRTQLTDNAFRDRFRESLSSMNDVSKDSKNPRDFLRMLYYCSIDTKDTEAYHAVKDRLAELDKEKATNGNYLFYLATSPSMYKITAESLGKFDLQKQDTQNQNAHKKYRRLIVEKPFGYDLDSARKLNTELHNVFDEEQMFRIDHYLGKETVQNLFVTRFANGMFEPIWNRNYIHHIEITSCESIGIENRGKYYETSGALRDMVQNHLLQLVSLVAMEPPSSFQSNSVRNEKLKVFESLRAIKDEEVAKFVIRGQYGASRIRGENVLGYRQERDISKDSRTETYVAVKFFIDNWRWGGMPFYIRTGKRLPTTVAEIVIHFKATPHKLFQKIGIGEACNQLVIRIQPDEGILLRFGMKVPGAGFNVQNVNMIFKYSELSDVYLPAAYERLLLDSMLGDSTLFSRGDSVIECWKFVEPILRAWKNDPAIKLYGYPAGTWGPEHADDLIEESDMTWRYPCKNLSDSDGYCEL